MVSGWFGTTLAQTVLAERKRSRALRRDNSWPTVLSALPKSNVRVCSVYFLKWSLRHLGCACHKRKPFRIYPKRISASAHAFRHFDYCRSWFRLLVHFDYTRSLKFCVWSLPLSTDLPRSVSKFVSSCKAIWKSFSVYWWKSTARRFAVAAACTGWDRCCLTAEMSEMFKV